MEPQDDDDDWDAKTESKTEIILKSSEDYTSAGAFASSRGEGRGLILNRPAAGSPDGPAAVCKSDPVPPRSRSPIGAKNPAAGPSADTALRDFLVLLRTAHRPSLEVVEMDGDGNCLFRAISLQVYGDQSNHADVRRSCLDFMERESDHYREFVADEDFADYVARKRADGVHGNHAEIQAMSELYNRSIEVFVPAAGIEPINIFHKDYKGDDPPIRLCYMDGNHYDAIVDPLVPTAGLGLGLPGLEPGLADRLQVQQAKRASDEAAGRQSADTMKSVMAESVQASKKREEMELKEAIRKSEELVLGDGDFYGKKKALYLSDLDSAEFDLEQVRGRNCAPFFDLRRFVHLHFPHPPPLLSRPCSPARSNRTARPSRSANPPLIGGGVGTEARRGEGAPPCTTARRPPRRRRRTTPRPRPPGRPRRARPSRRPATRPPS